MMLGLALLILLAAALYPPAAFPLLVLFFLSLPWVLGFLRSSR